MFGRKNGLVGHREIKRMHMLLDLDGLLSSIQLMDPEYMPHLLDYIEDILRRYPSLKPPQEQDIANIMAIPLSGNMILQSRWLSLCIHLIERDRFDQMLRGGIASALNGIMIRDPGVPDVRVLYMLAIVSSTEDCSILSNTESIGRLMDVMDKGDVEEKRFVLTIMENISARIGIDVLTDMGGLERFRTHIIDDDPEVSSIARYLMGRVEADLVSRERRRSVLAIQSTVVEEPVTVDRKAEKGTGYYRPERKVIRRSRPARAQDVEVVEDLSLRKRRHMGKYEKDLKAALDREANSTYDPDEEFVIEE